MNTSRRPHPPATNVADHIPLAGDGKPPATNVAKEVTTMELDRAFLQLVGLTWTDQEIRQLTLLCEWSMGPDEEPVDLPPAA